MRRIDLIALSATFTLACGGPAPTKMVAPNPVPTPSASAPSSDESVPLVGVGVTPSGEARLAPLETVLPSAKVAIHLDAKKLRDAPVFTSVMTSVRLFASGPIDEATRACGFSIIEAVDGVVISGDERPVLGIKVNVPAKKALACIKTLGNGSDETYRDLPAARVRGTLLVATGDMLVAASGESQMDEVLARKGKGPIELAQAVTLGAGEVLAVRANVGGEKGVDRADARLVATEAELGLHARAECVDEASAKMLESQKDMAMDLVAGASGTPEGKEIVKSIVVRQEGKTVTLDMGVKGDARAQAQYVSTLAAAGIGAFKQYLAAAKTAEARSNVARIAMGLTAYAEQNKKFPPSAPAVPKDAPRAMKYQSSPNDWTGSWKLVQFELDSPQYYSYSFKTATDGRSCVVTAHGDLNGDGKTSTFEMKVELTKDKGVKRGRLVVKDELE